MGIVRDKPAILVLSRMVASSCSKNDENGAALEVAGIMSCCSICAMTFTSSRIIMSVE